MKTILKNATLLSEDGTLGKRYNVIVENKRIASISEAICDTSNASVYDCQGNLLIPAFYNAHCHAAMTLFRGYGEDLPLQRWLDERILPAEDRLTYQSVYAGTKWAIAEMIRGGVVSFSDMYMFEDAVADAVLETGVKANVSRSIVSFDPDLDMKNDHRMKEAVALFEKYHNADDGRLMVDMALHAEYTNVPRACAYVADFACANSLRMQLHLSETQKEHQKCLERNGKTPTRFFYDLGVLDVPTTAAHCVWVDEEDLVLFQKKKVSVAHNPISNLKLGSGIMNMPKMLSAGINVALGTDGTASNNRLDLLREMQTAAILHKGVLHDPASTTAKNVFPLATRNGAMAQGREDCGELAVGFRADLVLIDRNSIHNIPAFDDYAMLAYSAERNDVLMTMADGRILYQNGEYTSIDEERLRYECREVFDHYFD